LDPTDVQGAWEDLDDGKVIYEDNQGAIALAKNPEHHSTTKHIDTIYHFIRECVENHRIELQYLPTASMVADAMTKALTRDRHRELIAKMGFGPLWQNTTASPVEVHDPTGNVDQSGAHQDLTLSGSDEDRRT
jgi:hypothetical protein